MSITFFVYKDMKIKVDRPIEIQSQDDDIGNRCYEKLKNVVEEDDWTKRIDDLIVKYNIKYEIANEEEFKEFAKNANDITVRNFKFT